VNEPQARTVLLVRAIEEADLQSEILSRAERARATRDADPPAMEDSPAKAGPSPRFTPQAERFLIARAERLQAPLIHRFASVRHTLRHARWRSWLSFSAVAAALLLGLAANKLGPEKQISILAFPLLATLLWNLAVYIFLLARAAASLRRKRPGTEPRMPGTNRGWLQRWFQPKPPAAGPEGNRPEAIVHDGLRRFVADWLNWGAPLHDARLKFLLHSAAAVFAVGLIAGMYLRGMAFEYLAGWESTFLNSGQVHVFLQVILAPGSILTGIPIPDAEQIAALRWRQGEPGENAAPWIHLYAATTAVWVIFPRLLLAALAGVERRRLGARFPLPGPEDLYFRRLLMQGRGAGRHISVLPYSFAPERASKEALRLLVLDLVGGGVQLDFMSPLDYGMEDDYLAKVAQAEEPHPDFLVVLFNMAATPEQENHGRLLSGIKEAAARGKGPRQILALLDESAYRERLPDHASAEARLADRRKAWERMARDSGFKLLSLSLAEGARETSPQAWREALWNAPQLHSVP
jgi:hypothetical protein